MLFRQRFHKGIRDGSITLTFRTWKTPRVRAGGRYRLGPQDAVAVRSVETTTLGAITAADARRAGFASTEELAHELARSARRGLTGGSKVYRVAFRHVRSADPRAARRRDASDAALDDVRERLERMDRRSRRGPWTLALLRLVERYPRVRAADLAARCGRETRAFKADVRKLKELGLTVSHEVGYSLSPRGVALLAGRARRPRGTGTRSGR